MLFKVEMTVSIPSHLEQDKVADIVEREKKYAQALQQQGKWRHLWRVCGQYANVSIFDVEDNTELHQILSGLPLFPYMQINVVALCRHPSAIRDDDS